MHVSGQRDPLLRATRIAMVPMTLFAIGLAIYVKQTGILLTLAFDLLLACLTVPFILGLYWRRGTSRPRWPRWSSVSSCGWGSSCITPTIYGVDNTILYIPNGLVGAAFDGWPTFIAFAAAIITYVSVSLATPPAYLRGLDIQVAQDVDDALDDPDRFEHELVKANDSVKAT